MDRLPIYLDHNATTPLLPEVVDAMLPFLTEHFGNPSSSHVYGQRAKAAVDNARQQLAALLHCSSDEIVFTGGGTEANNLAIVGVTRALPKRRHIITTVIEHPATANVCRMLSESGYHVDRVGVDPVGQVSVSDVTAQFRSETALLTAMHSNNETGVLQPIAALGKAARERGILFHTDAAQSLGKLPVHVDDLCVDLLSVAGHKLYAPKGVGALYVRKGTPLQPLLRGAGHERGLRPGTENVASIVGLGAAAVAAAHGLDVRQRAMTTLRDRLHHALRNAVTGLQLNGHPEQRLCNTLNVRFPRVSGTALLAAVPEIAASTGSACHDGNETASAVIVAMGVPAEDAVGSVRLTLGRSTTQADVDLAARALAAAWQRLLG